MTIRLAITHSTAYRYDGPVISSYNEARMEPRSDRRQTVLSWSIDVAPAARIAQHVDYWGTMVHHFDVQTPHRELDVTATSLVETGIETPEPGRISWEEIEDPEVQDRFHELLAPSRVVGWNGLIHDVAAEIRGSSSTPAEAAEAAVGWINERLDYESGFTGVTTTAEEVLAAGRGVCQDFAHAALALLRCMGIPAWYVSGYLHPHREPEIGERVNGESHAWVAAWTGAVWPLDPTSLSPVHERHVRVAAGREYGDVAPFRGIFAGGGGGQSLDVSVEIIRRA